MITTEQEAFDAMLAALVRITQEDCEIPEILELAQSASKQAQRAQFDAILARSDEDEE